MEVADGRRPAVAATVPVLARGVQLADSSSSWWRAEWRRWWRMEESSEERRGRDNAQARGTKFGAGGGVEPRNGRELKRREEPAATTIWSVRSDDCRLANTIGEQLLVRWRPSTGKTMVRTR